MRISWDIMGVSEGSVIQPAYMGICTQQFVGMKFDNSDIWRYRIRCLYMYIYVVL